MRDRAGQAIFAGATVTFYPKTGTPRLAEVIATRQLIGSGSLTGKVLIKIAGDPFPVGVSCTQVQIMREEPVTTATATDAPNRRELRKRAAELHIPQWESMTGVQLRRAIAAAEEGGERASSARKTPRKVGAVAKRPRGYDIEEEAAVPTKAAKKSTGVPTKAPRKAVPGTPKRGSGGPGKKATPTKAPGTTTAPKAPARGAVDEEVIPFRKGTNLYVITKEIMKGGARMSIIDRMVKRIDLHPWAKKKPDLDVTFEMDKRILLTANILKRDFGWTVQLGGRGPATGTIKVTPPATKAKSNGHAKKAGKAA